MVTGISRALLMNSYQSDFDQFIKTSQYHSFDFLTNQKQAAA